MKRQKPVKPYNGAIWNAAQWRWLPPIGKIRHSKRRSPKQALADQNYEDKRRWFLSDAENGGCPIAALGLIPDYFGIFRPHFRKAIQIHHKKGKIGSLYLDETWWLGVSAEGLAWIYQHPSHAMELGFMVSRNSLKKKLTPLRNAVLFAS